MNRYDRLNLTKEQYKEYIRCYKIAREYFNLPKGWVLHHKDITLKSVDYKRYCEWRIDDLIPMSKSEHVSLHNKLNGPKSEETKQKQSIALIGRHWHLENGIRVWT